MLRDDGERASRRTRGRARQLERRLSSLWLCLAPLVLPFTGPPAAAWAPDPPSRTETVRDADGEEVTCTIYPDLILRQTKTDTPAPGDATLLRTGKRRPCSARNTEGAMAGATLATAYYAFAGRSGSYLLFEEADPHGAVGFLIVDARDGRRIVDDATLDGITQSALRSFVAAPGSLLLAYRRATNLSCSIPAAPVACWRSAAGARRGAVPATVIRLGPPVQACLGGYRAAGAPPDDPSVIAYDVQVTWKRRGRAQVRPSGPVACLPLP